MGGEIQSDPFKVVVRAEKCETILFHQPLRFLSVPKRQEIKNFKIFLHPEGEITPIEHKKILKYLCVKLDYLLRLFPHVLDQLEKAKTSFRPYSRIYFNRTLNHRAKVICYLLLMRPITYLLISYMVEHKRFRYGKTSKVRKILPASLSSHI